MIIPNRRLEEVYNNSRAIKFNSGSKIIILSDCHRGQGNNGDNFSPNQNLFFVALKHYYQKGFTYIELGDGDELWENRSANPIIDTHSDAFWIMSEFYKNNRFYMLYGNHDAVKRNRKYMNKYYSCYHCDAPRCNVDLFPDITAHEGLILENTNFGGKIFLVHGHQGDPLNDRLWILARFLVRYVWRPLELIGFLNPWGSNKSHSKKEKTERRLMSFAKAKNNIVIAGHTHRPYFSQPGAGLYFNDGCCVHQRCITGIEIENNEISLIKWSVCTRNDKTLYIGREILEGPVAISEYFK